MLNVPSILYINCIGSYYYSILENLNNDAKYHELLLYLSQGKLVYEAKDKQDIYAKYKNNRKYVIIRICQQLYFSDTLFS